MSLMIFVAPRLEWAPPGPGTGRPTGLAGLPALAKRALAQRDFALLTLGFFACGFQLAFLTTHLPAHLSLCGLPAGLGVTALMLVGLFNIPGSWLCGRIGNSIRPEVALGGIYMVRTIAIAIFANVTPTEWGTLIFAAVMGFIWLGTVPLTSAAIARRFGVADLGALYGICFFSHQMGGFLGAGAGASPRSQTHLPLRSARDAATVSSVRSGRGDAGLMSSPCIGTLPLYVTSHDAITHKWNLVTKTITHSLTTGDQPPAFQGVN
jgi:predicted MFS family arabinose efflux permease